METELKKESEKTLSKHSHRRNRHRDLVNKNSVNNVHNKNMKITRGTEDVKNKSRSGDQLKIKFCSRHEINHSSSKINMLPKEVMKSIQKLPSEIYKTNAFITDSIHSAEELDKLKNTFTTMKPTNINISRNKLATNKSKTSKNKTCELAVSVCSEVESIKDTKSKISSYLQSFITKPQGEPAEAVAKLKSHSSSKANRIKSIKECNLSKNHFKSTFPSKEDSKQNLRANYIQWLLAENKFFNRVGSAASIENEINITQSTARENETYRDLNENRKERDEKRKRTKKLHKHKKEKRKSDVSSKENGEIVTIKSSSNNSQHTAKRCEVIFNEIMSNKTFSVDQLRHIRWLASVENIIKIKSKEFIKRTISLNELYSYIPTHDDDDKIESLILPNHDQPCFKETRNEFIQINQEHSKNNIEPIKNYQTDVYTATIDNDFVQGFRQTCTKNIDYEIISEVKDSNESIESVSIAIKKTNNVFDSCGSFNIEIFHNADDLYNADFVKSTNMENYSHDSSPMSTKFFNYNENCYDGNPYIPNIRYCPMLKTPIDVAPHHELTHPTYYNSADNYYNTGSTNYISNITNQSQSSTSKPSSQRAYVDCHNQMKNNCNKSRIITSTNNYKCESEETTNKQRFPYDENEHFNTSYIKVNNQRPLIKNPTRDQLTDKKEEFSEIITSAEINLYGSSNSDNFCNQTEQYDINFTYDEYNSIAEHRYTENNEAVNIASKYSANSSLSNNDQKQNEILLVMSELKQKINFIQEQISFMNVNCNKCENIEVMLMKLKTDIAFGLKHVETKLKEIHSGKNIDKSKENSEMQFFKLENIGNRQPKLTKSLNKILKSPVKKFNEDDILLKSECYEVTGKDHKIFCDVLGNLTNHLKHLTSKEDKLDKNCLHEQNVNSKEIGLMTEESPELCNNCCNYVKINLNKSKLPIHEKETQCNLYSKQKEFGSNTAQPMSTLSTTSMPEKFCTASSNMSSEEIHINHEFNKNISLGRNKSKANGVKNKTTRNRMKIKHCHIF